jgi:ABC-type transport system involved in cytochrome bd biosynthesis fused ATPase/permease subunit
VNTSSIHRRRLAVSAAVAASVALSVVIGVRLSAFGVPLALLLACSLSCLATFSSLLFRVIAALSTTTHRCTRPGCDFRVSLAHTDAAESRRWQEIAAQHPHRTH